MSPTKAVIAATFGRGGQWPMRTAIGRLAFLFAASCSLSCAGYAGLRSLALQQLDDPQALLVPALLSFQAVVLTGLLATLGIAAPTNRDGLLRFFATLPLTDRMLWWLSYLPQGIVAGLTLLLSAGPLGYIFLNLGLHPLLLMGCCIGGALSAFGLLYGLGSARLLIPLSALPLLAYGEYKLASIGLQSGTLNDQIVATAALLTGCCLLSIRFIGDKLVIRRILTRNIPHRQINTLRTTWGYWHMKKLLRHNGMRLGFVTTVGMSSTLASAIYLSDFGTAVGGIIPTIVALLAAAYSSDVRSTLRRHYPFEISGLKGTYYFYISQMSTVSILSIFAVLPLLCCAGAQGLPVQHLVLCSISGVATGIFASTLIIPLRRDISSQIAAALLCLLLLGALPRFVPFWDAQDVATMLSVSAVLLVAGIGIEYKRNVFKWRNI